MNLFFIIYESCMSSYLRTLFIPLYRQLSHYGFEVDIIRITPTCKCQEKHPEIEVTSPHIRLHSLEISIRKPVTLVNCVLHIYSILKNTWQIRERSIVVLRSYIPAFFTFFSFVCRRSSVKWVYDCDGIASLEALENRASNIFRSLFYRRIVHFERLIVSYSDGLIVRSNSTLNFYEVDIGNNSSRHHLILDNCRDVNQLRTNSTAPGRFTILIEKLWELKTVVLFFVISVQ